MRQFRVNRHRVIWNRLGKLDLHEENSCLIILINVLLGDGIPPSLTVLDVD